MATADINDDLLTCSVCFNEFDDESHNPKFLACHHTLCLQCVKVTLLLLYFVTTMLLSFVYSCTLHMLVYERKDVPDLPTLQERYSSQWKWQSAGQQCLCPPDDRQQQSLIPVCKFLVLHPY